MDGYILDLRNKYQHIQPQKPQYSPHKHRPIYYGATQQLVQPTDTSHMKQEPPRVYGDTNVDLNNFVWSWTTLELNMWGSNMQNIWT